MRKIILILLVCLFPMAVQAEEYKILNQGNLPACTAYAIATWFDIVGDPEIDPVELYNSVNTDGVDGINAVETLNYLISQGAITAWEVVPKEDIPAALEESPLLLSTFTDKRDWKDGNITKDGDIMSLHMTVLTGYNGKYYTGINSWGSNWGFGGKYHLYNTNAIFEAFKITK